MGERISSPDCRAMTNPLVVGAASPGPTLVYLQCGVHGIMTSAQRRIFSANEGRGGAMQLRRVDLAGASDIAFRGPGDLTPGPIETRRQTGHAEHGSFGNRNGDGE